MSIFYPYDPEVPYLEHFKDEFSKVFIAFNPFFRTEEYERQDVYETTSKQTVINAKSIGLSSGVSWKEIANICKFSSSRFVNHALRLTQPSYGLDPRLDDYSTYRSILRMCQYHEIYIPEEGCISPPMEIAIANFLNSAGYSHVFEDDFYGYKPTAIKVSDLLNPTFSTKTLIYSEDEQIRIMINDDLFHILVCQTESSFEKINPANYFEGIQADTSTTENWILRPFD